MYKPAVIGASLSSFKNLNLEGAIDCYLRLADEFNLKAVEIRFEREAGRPSLWSWEAGDKVRSFLAKFEVAGVHLPFVYLNPISPQPEIKKVSLVELKQSLEVAAGLGAKYAVLHARGEAAGLSFEESMKSWKEVIGELAYQAQRDAILLAVENADSLRGLDNLAEVVQGTNSRSTGIALDIGHAHIRRMVPLSEFPVYDVLWRASDMFLPLSITCRKMPYEAFGSLKAFIAAKPELISVVHLHDYNGKHDHLPLGKGKINLSFLSVLGQVFKGPYIFEVDLVDHRRDFESNYQKFTSLIDKGRF